MRICYNETAEKGDTMSKLYMLCEKLNMDQNELSYFKNAQFLGTPIFHRASNLMTFVLEVENLLPYNVYDVFVSKLMQDLKCRVQMNMKVRVMQYDVVDINKYVKRIVERNMHLHVFMRTFPNFENGILKYQYANEEERKEADEKAPLLVAELQNYGIEIQIQTSMFTLESEVKTVKVEIVEEKKPVEVYKVEPKSFKKKSVNEYTKMAIKDLSEGVYNVKIEGKIFERENVEMRSGKIRQTLYISDNDNAIMMQRFERGNLTKEVLNEI